MNEGTIDLNEFLERVQGDKELLLELLDIFVDDFQSKRKLLQSAVSKNDYEQIRGIAHALKGASGNISAKGLRELLLHCEKMGNNQDLGGMEDLLKQLDKEFERVAAHIEVLKQSLKS